MRRFVTHVAALLLLAVGASHAVADTLGEQWTIEEASGTVTIKSSSGEMLGTQAGTQLVAPFTIKTGADGRVVVSHHLDRLTVDANSQSTIAVPKPAKTGVVTLIKQKLGSVLYEVEHRVKGNFEVDTPYLVSVVKGTTFNIHVTKSASSVSLVEGRLLVYTPDRKSELMLTPGQAAIKSLHTQGLILKDQQSLSAPVQGRVTIVKDGSGSAGDYDTTGSVARHGVLEQSPSRDIGSHEETGRVSGAEGSVEERDVDVGRSTAAQAPVGVSVGDGVIDLDSSKHGVGWTKGETVDLGEGLPGLSTHAGAGTDGSVDLDTSVHGVPANTKIEAGTAHIDTSVPGVSASATVGGGAVLDLGESVHGVSPSSDIPNSGSLKLDTSSPVISASPTVSSGTRGVSDTTPAISTPANLGNTVGNVNATVTDPVELPDQ